ncbi:cytochrome P450 [Collybia nuda]|uniref:Cytochrome P450 n=1 Tax=Collybia nuda TaxID=64659 RepID=A0A9P5YAF8_9AGAR|nr:cytochrome P450 [Collybia nuda]
MLDIPTGWQILLPIVLIFAFVKWVFTPPAELRHLPRAPILPLLWSYASGEVEDVRIKRLLLPFANEKGEGVVLVYALGRWIVHILDHQIAKKLSENVNLWPKEEPPDAMLLWRFVGKTNVILSNGAAWTRHSHVVKSALSRNLPIHEFVSLANKLFTKMGNGGLIQWDDYTMRFTLDAVGSTALGHNFRAIEDDHSPFVKQYNEVMDAISNPLFIVFPKLENWFPRKKIIANIDSLVSKFQGILNHKKENKGNDMLTYMLEEPGMTDEEYRDNMVVFFIAGHDTTAGAMSSLVYYLAKQPELQERAREEVLAALGNDEPNLTNLRKMNFVQACIRESLRINTPITYMVPRASAQPVDLKASNGKTYYLPPRTSVIFNITSIHHNETNWPNAASFVPERFLGKSEKDEVRVDASLWLPFALGPRQCPARNFAMYELRTLTAMLLQNWEWTLPKDSPHENYPKNGFSAFALSLPKDMYINFKKRK